MSAVPQAAAVSAPFLNTGTLCELVYITGTATVLVGCISKQAPFRRYLTVPWDGVLVLLAVLLVSWFLSLFLWYWLSVVIAWGLGLLFALGVGEWDPNAETAPKRLRGAIIEAFSGSVSRDNARPPPPNGQLTLAGWAIPPLDEIKHFKLIGTTGTGKSTAIRELLTGALQRGDRAMIADPDAGYLDRFYDPNRGDVILNPFDARSHKWDLFSEIRHPYDFEQLARSLIPDGVGEDRIFRQYAQTFLAAAMRQAHGSGIRDSAELYRLLVSAPLDELRLLLEGTPAQPFVAAGNDKMFGSIRSVTTNGVASLGYINTQRSTLFSIRRWVGEGRGVLFLPYQADQIAALHSTISSWMRIAIFETMTPPDRDAKLWFVVDELDALGPIDGLKDALPRLRKFGGRCVLGFQSIAQVTATYGRGQAEALIENCGNTLILRCSASEGGGTARFASMLIGEREIIRQQISKSRRPEDWLSTKTTTAQHHTEYAVLASQIEQLPDLRGYLKFASMPAWNTVDLLPL